MLLPEEPTASAHLQVRTSETFIVKFTFSIKPYIHTITYNDTRSTMRYDDYEAAFWF